MYAWKILIWQNFGHLRAKFGNFSPKFTVLRVFLPMNSKRTMHFPNFWYGSCSFDPLSENHTLYAGKILIWRNLVHLRPFLAKIDSFESS